jgi:signal transduction histidine kinase
VRETRTLGRGGERDALVTVVTVLRWTTLVYALTSAQVVEHELGITIGIATGLLVFADTWRTLRPLGPHFDTRRHVALLAIDLGVTLAAATMTGRFGSPFTATTIAPLLLAGYSGRATIAGWASAASLASYLLGDLIAGSWTLQDGPVTLVIFVVSPLLGLTVYRVRAEGLRREQEAAEARDELQRLNDLLASMHRLAQLLPISLDLDEVLDSARRRLGASFEGAAVAILVRDDGSGRWNVAAPGLPGLPPGTCGDPPGPLGQAVAEGRVIALDEIGGLSGAAGSGMYVPLVARGELRGALAVEHAQHNRYGPEDHAVLAELSGPVALAIDNARWFRRIRTLGADEERIRIARDLHDRVAQSLVFIGLELDRLAGGRASDRDVKRLRDEVAATLAELRESLYQLRSTVTPTSPLPVLAEELFTRIRTRSGMQIDFHTRGDGPPLPPRIEQEMWRILLEAISNIERHARATRLEVTWTLEPTVARLKIVDDGVGWVGPQPSGFGMQGMLERADAIGARIAIDGREGVGTRVLLELDRPEDLT